MLVAFSFDLDSIVSKHSGKLKRLLQ